MLLNESQIEIKKKCIFLNEDWLPSHVDQSIKSALQGMGSSFKSVIGIYDREFKNLNLNKFAQKLKEIDSLMKKSNYDYQPMTQLNDDDYKKIGLFWKNKTSNITNSFNWYQWMKFAFKKINGRYIMLNIVSSLKQYNTETGSINFIYVLYKNKSGNIKYISVQLTNDYFEN